MADPPANGYNYGSLEQKVEALAEQLRQIAADVRERQRFPWSVVISIVGVLLILTGMLGGLVMYGINANFSQDRKDIDRIEQAVLAITQATVPRGEHEQRWRSEEASVADVQRQIDQIRSDFGSSFSLNDTLKALMERVDRLEQIRLEQSVQ